MNLIESEAKEAYIAQQSDICLFSDSESKSDTIPLQNSKALSRKKRNAIFHDFSDSEVNKENSTSAHQEKPRRKKFRGNTFQTGLISEIKETNKLIKKLTTKIKNEDSRLIVRPRS